ncbi:class I SAM-dependent methyltransferase [Halanaerobaculum tunisiense]
MTENKIKKKYDRIAPIYDLLESIMERGRLGVWRQQLWAEIKTEAIEEEMKLLEVGVGTGKNITYYPSDVEVYAIDFSQRMLDQARDKADQLGVSVNLSQMDVQDLEFADDYFDLIVASCVFCSVPDPVQGFKELRRVCKPEGKIFLLEHMRTECQPWAQVMDSINWISLLLWGANINRQTMANIQQANLKVIQAEDLWFDIVKKLVLSPEV